MAKIGKQSVTLTLQSETKTICLSKVLLDFSLHLRIVKYSDSSTDSTGSTNSTDSTGSADSRIQVSLLSNVLTEKNCTLALYYVSRSINTNLDGNHEKNFLSSDISTQYCR